MVSDLRRCQRAARVVVGACAILVLAACGDDQNGAGTTTAEEPTAASTPTVAPAPTVTATAAPEPSPTATATTPIAFTDYTGIEVVLEQPAERIVCLHGACVDALAELGMTPVAIPGRTDVEVAFHPEYFGDDASAISVLGGNFFEPDLEDVAAAEPDLVIGAACFHDGLRDALAGIAPLGVFDLGSYQLAIENLRIIGGTTGRGTAAEAAIATLEERIADYADQAPGDKVPLGLIPTTEAPLIDSTDSQSGSVFSAVGEYPWPAFEGDSCLGGGQVSYSLERVLEVDPDVIFVISSPGSERSSADFEDSPVWGELTAVQAGQVHDVASTIWSIGGTRSARLMLDEAMTLMYPDVFAEPLS